MARRMLDRLHPLGGSQSPTAWRVDDLIGGLAEDIDVLLAHLLADLHIGTVHGAQRQRAVQTNSGVAGAEASRSSLICSTGRRDQLFGGGNVV